MFPTLARLTSRTTYRGSRGSGSGRSSKTSSRSSPFSRPTALTAQLEGRTFKASQRGLYHGVLLQSGNNLPKSRQKTPRTWRPNVQPKLLFSSLLQQDFKTRLTTRALRTIRKKGGLDEYLATTRDDRLLGAFGRELKGRIGDVVRMTREFESQRPDLTVFAGAVGSGKGTARGNTQAAAAAAAAKVAKAATAVGKKGKQKAAKTDDVQEVGKRLAETRI